MLDKFLSYDSRNRGQMFIYMPYPGTPLYDTAVKLGFQEPKHLDGWTHMRLYEKQTPWVTTKQAQLVSMISSYIFMFLDADTIVWAKGRIKNPIKKLLFVWAYEIFAKIAKFRENAAEAAALELQEPKKSKRSTKKEKASEIGKSSTAKINKFRKSANKLSGDLSERYSEEVAREAETKKLAKKDIEGLVIYFFKVLQLFMFFRKKLSVNKF